MCKGTVASTLRMSFEYLPGGQGLYGCYGACGSNCQNEVSSGTAYVYVR